MNKIYKKYNRYVAHFPSAMAGVDEYLIEACGMTRSCLVDAPYWSMWEEGATPLEMAQEVLRLEFGKRAPSISAS
jgi:hypothetical protein